MIQAIDRAAKVLELLQGSRHLGITDLATALQLPPSTVHGIVSSLREHGLVAKERGGQRYMLGPTLLKLSSVYLDSLDVRARSLRWTQELARRTGMAVRLGVPHFIEVLVVHHTLRPDDSPQMLETGVALPAHASAMGKVLLAHDLGLQSAVFAEPLASLTGDTVTDPAVLAATLPGIAEHGFATETDEAVLGESSLASPVADARGDIVAAVAIVFPTAEGPAPDAALHALRDTARNISRELGATTWPPPIAPPEDPTTCLLYTSPSPRDKARSRMPSSA